ncbi:hypothetical protein IFO70_16150 [Phormidium tenue FACHB-886]|nr:hypothetical protein [Phormidium tenue FACHB-886]
MVIDPLEPYRKMARSIRFVPPLAQANRLQKQTGRPEPIVHAPAQACGWSQSLSLSQEAAIDPVLDPSEHVAALVKSAVSQPTVLPVIPLIQENIGDRISRLEDNHNRAFVPVLPEVTPPKVAPVEQAVFEEWVQPIEEVSGTAPTIQAETETEFITESVTETESVSEVKPAEPDAIFQDAISQTTVQLEATQPIIQPPPVEERSPAVELPTKPTVKANAMSKVASSKAAKSKSAPKKTSKKTKGFGAKAK